MKKHKNRMISLVSGVIIIFALLSCEDFLNQVPGDKITPEQHYKTGIDAFSSTIGAYAILQEVMPNLVVLNELRSDLLVETENFDSDIRQINRYDITLHNKFIDPTGFYRIVFNCNEVLNHLENIQTYDRDFDSTSLAYATIDMISLRSWAYFTLARLYGEAAYIPQDMLFYDEGYQFKYYSKNQMIDMLISDLDIASYPDIYVNRELDPVRVYERALRGELYLEKGDFANASKYLIDAIGDADINQRFKLVDYTDENWKFIFVNSIGQSPEVMSAVPYSYIDLQENPLSDIFFADRDYLAKPSPYIVNLFNIQTTQESDTGDTYRGNGISFKIDSASQKLIVNKYSLNESEFSGADIVLYRAADVQLLLAEALNQMGNHDAALSIINAGYKTPPGWRGGGGVRNRVLLNLVPMPASNIKTTLEDIIMEERAMELAFEGKRWFDLVRVANRRGENYLAGKVSSKFEDATIASEIYDKLMDKKNWYLPFRK